MKAAIIRQHGGAAGLRPVIDSARPLEDVRAATERMEAGEQFGKIVLTVP